MEQLLEACGGRTKIASSKRLILIRFPRGEGTSEDQGPEIRKDQILRDNQIPRDGDRFLLQEGDLIYFPEKYVVGE